METLKRIIPFLAFIGFMLVNTNNEASCYKTTQNPTGKCIYLIGDYTCGYSSSNKDCTGSCSCPPTPIM